MRQMDLIARVEKIIAPAKNYDDAVIKVSKKLLIPIKLAVQLVNEATAKSLSEKNVCAILRKEVQLNG